MTDQPVAWLLTGIADCLSPDVEQNESALWQRRSGESACRKDNLFSLLLGGKFTRPGRKRQREGGLAGLARHPDDSNRELGHAARGLRHSVRECSHKFHQAGHGARELGDAPRCAVTPLTSGVIQLGNCVSGLSGCFMAPGSSVTAHGDESSRSRNE